MQSALSEDALEKFALMHLKKLGYTIVKHNEYGPTHLYIARKKNNDGKWFYQTTINPTKRRNWWTEEAEIAVKDLDFKKVRNNNDSENM